jgi:imidazolonepropionase-like amidohydrolase
LDLKTPGSYDLPHQAGNACAYGLPWDAAIRALTLDAAEILGVGDQMGSLEKGRLGNAIVTDGDPLEMTINLRCPFINGRCISLESKWTQLYERYKARIEGKG